MYRDKILDFIDKLSNPPNDLAAFLKTEKSALRNKGYGTPELEMKYMHKIFLYIQAAHPEFESFCWQQCNEYNDNYFHFQLHFFIINDKFDAHSDMDFHYRYDESEALTSKISFYTVDFPDPKEIEIAQKNDLEAGVNDLDYYDWDVFKAYIDKKYQYLEIPTLKFLTFLKLLEINYSMYYFLYSFGNGVEVKFNKEGVTVTKLDENETDSSPLGDGMYFDDDDDDDI